MLRLDKKSLISQADARNVARFIGMKVQAHGNTTYGECVSGLHSEKKHDNNVIYKDGCHCFSCGESFNTIDMVMKFCSVGFKEACNIIAESIGMGADDFRKEESIIRLPLTEEELKEIGLAGKTKSTAIDTKDIEKECSESMSAKLLYVPMSIRTLYKEEPDVFIDLCIDKAQERVDSWKSLCAAIDPRSGLYAVMAVKHNETLLIKKKLEKIKEGRHV